MKGWRNDENGFNVIPKVPYFFFPWKRLCPLTHSNLEKSVFFFSENLGKKKYSCIFFFPGKDYIPLTQLFSVRSKFGQITIDLKTVFFQNSPALKMANVFFKKIRCLGADCVKIL